MIAKGRMHTEAECQKKASEMVELFKMWGITKADSYRIAAIMKSEIQNTHNDKWTNPLDGTGLTTDTLLADAKNKIKNIETIN